MDGLKALATNDPDGAMNFREGLQDVSRDLDVICRAAERCDDQDAVLMEIIENMRNGLSMIPSLLRNQSAL